MSLILDSSAALSWCFEDERTDTSTACLQAVVENGAVAPQLWRIEMANSLTMAMRRKRIDEAFRDASLRDLAVLPIVIDRESDGHIWGATLRLADQFGLTVYDAVYLELALRRQLPLVTLDEALRKAARASGCQLFEKST